MNYKTLFEDILKINADDTKVVFEVSGETPNGDSMGADFKTEDLQEAIENFTHHNSIYTTMFACVYYKEEWIFSKMLLFKGYGEARGLLVDADVYKD